MEERREGEEEKEGRGEGVVETTWFIWSSSNGLSFCHFLFAHGVQAVDT